MSLPRPTDGYKGQMTTPPDAWPDADEDALQSHADDLGAKQTQLQKPLDKWRLTRTQIFDGSTWFGSASKGASAAVDARINAMQSIDDDLTKAIGFFRKASEIVRNAKQHIIAICNQAQQEIEDLANQDFQEDSDRQTAIKAIVDAAHQLNTATVAAAAAAVGAGQEFSLPPIPAQIGPPLPNQGGGESGPGGPLGVRTPGSAAPAGFGGRGNGETKNLVNQTTRPSVDSDSAADKDQGGSKMQNAVNQPPAAGTTPGGTPAPGSAPGTPPSPAASPPPPAGQPAKTTAESSGVSNVRTPAPAVGPQLGGSPSPVSPNPSPGMSSPGPAVGPSPKTTGGIAPSPMSSQGPSGTAGPGPSTPGSPSTGPESGASPGNPAGGHPQDANAKPTAAGGQGPLTPAQQQAVPGDLAKGMASGGGQPLPSNPMVSPASAVSMPVNPQVPVDAPPPAAAGPGASGSGGLPSGGGFSGGGGGSASPPMGGGTPAMPPPMPLGPPATPTPAAPLGSGAPGAGVGGGPAGPNVSPASTTATGGGAMAAPVPVSAARQERDAIAASAAAGAAARRGKGNDPLTLARRVAAALNVGVMDFGFFWVTGLCTDGTIVVANSYGLGYIPEGVNLPIQIHLATADETIPPSERAKWATYPMLAVQGWAQAHEQKLRAVIATEAQFADFDPGTAKVVLRPDDIPDTGKMEGRSRLEVIAPGAAARLAAVGDAALVELLPPPPADTQAPTDESAMKWFELCKPLMSTMPDRGAAHLQAFVAYAEHAQELALYRAHIAPDATTQRAAIADWVYWQHLSVLMTDALSADAAV